MIAEPPPAPVIDVTAPKAARQGLLDAARYIEEHGWTQGLYEHFDGQVCMVGALWKVFGGNSGTLQLPTNPNYSVAHGCIEEFLRQKRGWGTSCTGWNDAPTRTKEQVIDLLRTVAAGVEE